MEAKLMKIFAVFLLSSIVCNLGHAQHCSLSDLAVTQTVLIGPFQTVYKVTVENRCTCAQSNVKVTCPGLRSNWGIDPAVMRLDRDGKLCTLNNGAAIGKGPEYAVKFPDAAASQIEFKPVSSTINCS